MRDYFRVALSSKICVMVVMLLVSLLAAPASAATPVYGYKVVATYPHSTARYT